MTLMESMPTWASVAEANSGGLWPGRTERMWRAGASDGALTGFETRPAGPACGALTPGMDLSDVRLKKVVQLRAAITSGCYKVSAANLADKLMASVSGGDADRERYD